MTFPAPTSRATSFPGGCRGGSCLGCRPADLFDRIKKLPGFEAKELSMDLSPEAKAVQGCRLEELEEWVSFYIRRERQWLHIVEMLEREDPSELTAILFDGVDKIQHLCWRFIDPAFRRPEASEQDERMRSLCLEYYRQLDEILSRIFAMRGPEDTTFIASTTASALRRERSSSTPGSKRRGIFPGRRTRVRKPEGRAISGWSSSRGTSTSSTGRRRGPTFPPRAATESTS
jgi:hypothetical protein